MQKFVEQDQNVIDEVERTKWKRTLLTLAKDWRLYVLLVPMLAFLICFKYLPIGGILTGFKWGDDGNVYNAEWCGLTWAKDIFMGPNKTTFWTAFRNTFINSMYGLIFGFPIPIFLALLFSEIKSMGYRSFLQVCCYLPHFISLVVVTTLITLWCQGPMPGANGQIKEETAGVIYKLCKALGAVKDNNKSLLAQPKFFRPIYQVSGVWEGAGYGSIVYFAAIVAISPTSYEAARIDGASKLQQIRYVTLPGMAPTLTIMLIMRIGQILNIGYEKVILLVGDKKDAWETADVVSAFVYRMSGRDEVNAASTGITAYPQIGIVADLFNAILAMCLVLGANAISRRVSSTSLF